MSGPKRRFNPPTVTVHWADGLGVDRTSVEVSGRGIGVAVGAGVGVGDGVASGIKVGVRVGGSNKAGETVGVAIAVGVGGDCVMTRRSARIQPWPVGILAVSILTQSPWRATTVTVVPEGKRAISGLVTSADSRMIASDTLTRP